MYYTVRFLCIVLAIKPNRDKMYTCAAYDFTYNLSRFLIFGVFSDIYAKTVYSFISFIRVQNIWNDPNANLPQS